MKTNSAHRTKTSWVCAAGWPGGLARALFLWTLCCTAYAAPDTPAQAKPPPADLPIFTFAAENAGPEFGGQWGLWPQQEQCKGTATFLPGQDAEGGGGGAMQIEYDIRGEPRSFSLWITPGTETVDLSAYDRFVVFAKGTVPSFTLVVKDRNATDPTAADGIADCPVTGLTAKWQRFDVPFRQFVPRKKGAAVDWHGIKHVGIALIAPRDRPRGTLFVDNLRVSTDPKALALQALNSQQPRVEGKRPREPNTSTARKAETPARPAVVSDKGWKDDFDGRDLDPRWQWRVPVPGPTVSLKDNPGWLRVRLPERASGFNHWNEPKLVDEAPQLRTHAPQGDWKLEARVHLQLFSAAGHFQVGLVAGVSDDFLFGFGPFQSPTLTNGPKTPEVCFEPTGLSCFCRVPGDARDVRLRLVRTGGLLRARFSRDGKHWLEAGAYLLPAAPRFVGLWGKTFSKGTPVAFDVDYIRLTALPAPAPGQRYARVGIGGDYPTGYSGLLARNGLPHEVLLDYQLAEPAVLRRFDMILVGSMNSGIAGRAREALMRYVREGGTALLDGTAYPPPSVVKGKGARVNAKKVPDILVGGAHNPLTARLGKTTRFAAGETRFHFEPASFAGFQILARYDGQPGSKAKPTAPYTGTPAIWAMPLGRGLLVYSSPCLGATLSWGPAHDTLAAALLQCLASGRLEPQLVPEGTRFGRRQNALTRAACAVPTEVQAPPTFTRSTLSSPAGDLPPGASRIRNMTAPEFNLSGVYRSDQGSAQLLLNHWSREFRVNVIFKGRSVRVDRVENGKVVDTAEMRFSGTRDVPFLVKERRDNILLVANSQHHSVRADGLWAGKLAYAGKALTGLRYQPVEPPFLSDDFMRGEKEQGAWKVVAGKWSVRAKGNPQMGANPFTYRGQAKGVGLSVTGLPFWDDYAFDVSVKPTSAGGAVAQAFHFRDPANHLLFRVRVSNSPGKTKNGVELVRVAQGKETVLTQADGCLIKGQWYRLAVQVRNDTVTASVDGRQVATAKSTEFQAGKVALYVRDAEAEFDDVAVRPIADAAEPKLVELDGPVPRFAGTMDRDTWAGTVLQWRADPSVPGRFWRRGRFWGDFDLSFRCDFGDKTAGPVSLALLLTMPAGPANSGYRLALRPTAQTKPWENNTVPRHYTVELTRGSASVGHCAITSSAKPVIELRRVGSRLLVLIDGHQTLQFPLTEPQGKLAQLGFQATGFRPRISGLRLRAGNVLDTHFDHAPVNWWVGSGTWDLAVRWPCTPDWSWLAGEGKNRGVAALWHKRRFTGDLILDAYIGPRMVDHGDKHPREICRAFNLVICGDGRNVKSGYSFVVGADKKGAGAYLMRKGKIVARESTYRIYSDAHNQWINVRAEKQGATIRLWVDDQRVLSWNDPKPLTGGRLAIWTDDNSIMIPRVTIYHRESPTSDRWEQGGA